MIFDGIPFRRARNIVTIPPTGKYAGNYIEFGKVCLKDAKGAVETMWRHHSTQVNGQPEVVWAKPIQLQGHNLTNMAYGTDGRFYLLKDGVCYRALTKKFKRTREEKRLERLYGANPDEPPRIPFEIESVSILTGHGTDKINFVLKGPTPFPEMKYQLSATIDARAGYGEEWVRANFPGVEPKIIHY